MNPRARFPSVRLAPAFDALYYSFYLEGLRRSLPASRLRLDLTPFPPDLGSHGLALEVEGSPHAPARRIFISASDGPKLNPVALAWCDVYAKVNLDGANLPAVARGKCLAIGPSFPVRVWGPAVAWTKALSSFVAARGRVPNAKEHFANYRRQYRYRLPEIAFSPAVSDPRYVFFAATLWSREAETNRLRAAFLQAAKSLPGLEVEGGFAPRRSGEVPGFETSTAPRRFTMREYLEKTRRSAVAFHTPAVSGCHGWKLGEFLALGKAIVATRLSRDLPAPLEHGEHLHLAGESQEAIAEGIARISRDAAYRGKLETNARRYYLEHLRPERVVARVFAAVGVDLPERRPATRKN